MYYFIGDKIAFLAKLFGLSIFMKKKILAVFAGVFFALNGASSFGDNKTNNVPEPIKEAEGWFNYISGSTIAQIILIVVAIVIAIVAIVIAIMIWNVFIKPFEPREKKRKILFFEKECEPEISKELIRNEEEKPTAKIEGASESPAVEIEDEVIEEKKESGEKSDFAKALELIEGGQFNEGYELFQKTTEASGNSKTTDLSILARFGLGKGFDEALVKLRELADGNPDNSIVHTNYSKSLIQAENFEQNHLDLRSEYDKAKNENIKVAYLEAISKLFCSVEDFEGALKVLKDEIKNISEAKNKSSIYQELGDLYFKWKGDNSQIGFFFLEKAVDLNPNNIGLKFDLGYKYMEQSNNLLSFYHNHQLTIKKPKNQAGLNNKGVAASRLNFKFAEVDCYLRAIEQKHTLASANLASVLIEAGFYEQARGLLEEARKHDDYHDKVNVRFGSLVEKKEAEDKKINEIIPKCDKLTKFHSKSGEALAMENFEYAKLVGEYDGTPHGLKLYIDNSGQLSGEVILSDDSASFSALQDLSKNLEIEGKGNLLIVKWKLAGLGESLLGIRKSILSGVARNVEGGLIIQKSGAALEGYFSKEISFSDIEIFDWKLDRKED